MWTTTIFLVPLIAGAIFLIIGNGGRRVAMTALAAISVVFIYLVGGVPTIASALILIVPAFVFKEFMIRHDKPPRWMFWVGLVVTLTLFFILKDYFNLGQSVVEPLSSGFALSLLATLGLSFIIFRAVEYLLIGNSYFRSRARRGQVGQFIARPGTRGVAERFNRYLGFCLAFPSFTSGPILRWRTYLEDATSEDPIFVSRDEQKASLRRLANGLFKISLLSQPLLLIVIGLNDEASIAASDQSGIYTGFILAASLFYLVFLYINFSGFTDVMIASGKAVGLRLPENFDAPFSTRNFLDFWSHWHISVSLWFRDMMFTPIVKFFVLRGVKSNFACSAAAYVVTFGLLGLWHGRTWPFLLCGFMLALGALANQIWREYIRVAPKGPFGQAARALTYLYIAVAIIGLWLAPEPLAHFWDALVSVDGIAAVIAAILALTVALYLFDGARLLLKTLENGPVHRLWTSPNLILSIVKTTVAIGLWWWTLSPDAGFVYEGF